MRRLTLFALVLVALMIPALAASAAKPGWIVSCDYSHSSNDDPIVYPGQPGAAHLHDFVGATTTNAGSTPDSLRAGGTTCAIAGDHAGYWAPALFKNGIRVLPTAAAKDMLVYYRRVGAPTGTTVQPIPDGLKMILGNAHANNASENPRLGTDIIFKCGPGISPDLPQPPSQCSAGIMVVGFRFPNCWDGVNLDSADHISHMAYPVRSRCPASHPVNIPRIETFIRYGVGTGAIGEITFSSGAYYTVHQDFFSGWVQSDLQSLVTRCINGGIDCGTNPTP